MTICIAEKLDITCQLEKGEQIVDIWHNVRFIHSSIHTICDNTDSNKVVSLPQSYLNEP